MKNSVYYRYILCIHLLFFWESFIFSQQGGLYQIDTGLAFSHRRYWLCLICNAPEVRSATRNIACLFATNSDHYNCHINAISERFEVLTLLQEHLFFPNSRAKFNLNFTTPRTKTG